MAALRYSDLVDGGLYIRSNQKGQPNGVASLNNDGKVPLSQLPNIGGGGTPPEVLSNTGLIFSFRVEFNLSNPSAISEVPIGWSISFSGSQVNVTHNVNKMPKLVSYLGFNTNSYKYRTPTPFDEFVVNNSTKLTAFSFSLTNDVAGSQQSGHAYVNILF